MLKFVVAVAAAVAVAALFIGCRDPRSPVGPMPGGPQFQAAGGEPTGRIAFTSSGDGSYEIFVINADGSEVAPRTSNSAHDAWSPDGTWIAFSTFRDGDDEIMIMKADGSTEIQVTSNDDIPDLYPAWQPVMSVSTR